MSMQGSCVEPLTSIQGIEWSVTCIRFYPAAFKIDYIDERYESAVLYTAVLYVWLENDFRITYIPYDICTKVDMWFGKN